MILRNNSILRLNMANSWIKIILIIALSVGMAADVHAKGKVRTVKVGFFDFKGYQETDADGNRSGYGYDFLGLLQRYENLKFEYVGKDCNWPQMLDMLRRGEIDMLTSSLKTPEREKEFAFSYVIGMKLVLINVRVDDNRFRAYDCENFDGITIGLLEGYNMNKEVERFAKENKFTFKPRYYSDEETLTKALKNKEVDAVATSSLRRTHNEKTIAAFDSDYFYAIVQHSDSALLRTINNAIVQMNENEDDWQKTLFMDNYVDVVEQEVVFTPDEKEYIKAHSTDDNPIVIAADNAWKPFSYLENGKHKGIIPDYWREILAMTGMKYRFDDFGEDVFHISHITEGKADIYLGTSLSANDAEKQNMLVSATFMTSGVAMLHSRNKKEIKLIAVCDLTPYLNSTLVLHKGQKTCRFYSSDEAYSALKKGDVDAIYCYSHDAERIMNSDRSGFAMYDMVPGVTIGLKAMTSLDADHRLMSIMSKCINKMKGSQTESIIAKNLTMNVSDFTLVDWMFQHPYLSILSLILLILVIYFLINMFILLRGESRSNKLNKTQLAKIRLLNTQLQEATRDAKAANKAKSNFLFNMSHDIRTPMNAIIGFANLIEKNVDNPEKCSEYIGKVKKSSDFLLSLINNVLEMARIESGKVELNETPILISSIMESVMSVYEEQMKQKKIDFAINLDINTNAIYCDEVKVKEVLLNLVSNAYKYTHEGGRITLNIEELPCEREGYVNIRTMVSDTGIGMSKEYLPKLFEEFTREQNSTESKIEGTGLGMAIVKRLIELMGGTISVESELGKGTTFIINLSHKIAEIETEVSAKAKHNDEVDLVGKRLLLAEDNDLNAEIAMEILGEIGIVAERAEDGERVIEMLTKAESNYYDAILMDVQMPKMNGYEATRIIRQFSDKVKAEIPILAMTANAFDEDKQEAIKAGMNGHLSKPINIGELMKKLNEL